MSFQRDFASERLVLFGHVDGPHAAFTDQFADLVRANLRVNYFPT